MKMDYVKPDAKYVSLEAKDLIANMGPDGEMGNDDDFDFSNLE